MFRFNLRTLLIALALGPPLLARAFVAAAASWPVFLVMGYVVYIALAVLFSLVIGSMLGWAFDTAERPLKRE
jgi:hypothetical protein